MNYKLLMEDWKKFLKEYERGPGERTFDYPEYDREAPLDYFQHLKKKYSADKIEEPVTLRRRGKEKSKKVDKDEEIDIYGPPLPDDYLPPLATPHVDRAISEMGRWGGRHETDKSRGEESPNAILSGYYDKVDELGLLEPGTANYWKNQNKQGKYPHWSAIFIQYCMQDNDKFIKMQINGAGAGRNGTSHHKYYYSARENWDKLTKGKLDDSDAWIFFTIKEARKIGYVATPGDISFLQKGSKPIQAAIDKGIWSNAGLHADIITKKSDNLSSGRSMGAIGGNVGAPGTAGYSSSPRYAFMSQRPEVKKKVRAAYGLNESKFLKEYDDRIDVASDQQRGSENPPDHGWGGYEKKFDEEEFQKNKDMFAFLEDRPSKNFPVVNKKELILPIEGVSKIAGGFKQQRRAGGKQGWHAAIDQGRSVGAKPSTPLRALADGRIVSSNKNTYDGRIAMIAKNINERISKGLIIQDVTNAMSWTSGLFQSQAKVQKKGSEEHRRLMKKSARSLQSAEKIAAKYSNKSVPKCPLDWAGMRKWANYKLGIKVGSRLVRYYNEVMGLDPKFPLGGVSLTLRTDPDQYGNVFSVFYGHLQEVNISGGRVEQGDIVGTVGDTGIFDPWTEHLHMGVYVHSDNNWPHSVEVPSHSIRGLRAVDPLQVIPDFGKAGIYESIKDSEDFDPWDEFEDEELL